MMPKFADSIAWKQAELLMQPAFIRVIDNIRKQLERSPWKGEYRTIQTWPEGTPDEVQGNVANLQQQLTSATPEEAAKLEQELAQLPQPYQRYELCLEQQGLQATIDLWELCYQICFRNYDASTSATLNHLVEIDTALIDETGDVDWQRLDHKTKQLVEGVFAHLPTITAE
ncbi:hypothetical protein IQ268_02310 [Oculatella sp. LEGE 06141]|uniref:hypothetical protein n=1 Tax=Oculatella sp. LEGE 06141 TaxID=1828648 RepID=UPI001880AEAA|nr:hypothetical protein [Oculatella sp. LEGE 06141]MBE9177408.1 hypothetical protein [Oculatella sp. LEGE 06141]